MSLFKNKKSGFTLMEIAISVLIVAIVIAISIPVIRGQLKKSDEYSYYLAYKTVEKLAGQIAALGDPNYASTSQADIKQRLALLPAVKLSNKYAKQKKSHPLLAKFSKNLANAELKVFKALFPKAYAETVTEKTQMFDSDEIVDLYYAIKVCIDGEQVETGKVDDEGNPIYYKKSDLGCQNVDGTNITDEGTTFTPKQIVENRVEVILMNSDTCFHAVNVCSSSDSESTCQNKISTARANARNSLINTIRSNGGNGGSVCTSFIPTYCKKYDDDITVSISYPQTGTDEDNDPIYTCELTKSYTVDATYTSGTETWSETAVGDDVCSSAKGFYNMYNAGGTYKIDCQCNSGYSTSENNSKACCQDKNTSELAYFNGTGCTYCTTDYNPLTKDCCKPYSTYNSSTSKCECISGYTGDGDAASGCVRGNSCPSGMQFDNTAKACVPAPPLIDAKRFCELIVANWNTASYSCSTFTTTSPTYYDDVYTAAYKNDVLNSIKGTSGAFKNITPNIVFSNGLKLWILGDRAASIPGLSYDASNAAKTQNMCVDLKKTTASACAAETSDKKYFCSSEYHCMTINGNSDLGDARNCCSASVALDEDADNRTMALSGFTVYVDINGNQGDGTLWRDVFPFYVTTTGRVFPAYPLDGAESHVGGNNSAYLPTDVYYYQANSNSRKRVLAFSEISYADAVCKAGIVNPYSPYCYNLGTTATGTNPCISITNTSATNKCFISVRRKGKFL